MKLTEPPLVNNIENRFHSLNISEDQSLMLQSNNLQFNMIQSFSPVSQTCTPRAIRKCSSYTDCSNLQEESPFSPLCSSESDSSSNDLLDMMNSLSLSGQQSLLTEQELANLHALHKLTNSGLFSVGLPTSLLHSMIHHKNLWNYSGDIDQLEKEARFYRSQAAITFKAACRWEGVIPRRFSENSIFSSKVFLGGVPWDVTEEILMGIFSPFGQVRVEWPGNDQAMSQSRGYVYIIFESEKHVKMLLNNCSWDITKGGCGKFSFRISSRKMKSKDVEVIPWCLADSNFVQLPYQKLNPYTTVFVGALHGTLNAEGLFTIMNELFGGVVYTGIDTDKFKYPIGSARVTFNNYQSYMKAVSTAFIEVKTTKFTKTIQVDPYLEDSLCCYCKAQQGLYFCRDFTCFSYFCRSCWALYHQSDLQFSHKPLMRSSKNNTFS